MTALRGAQADASKSKRLKKAEARAFFANTFATIPAQVDDVFDKVRTSSAVNVCCRVHHTCEALRDSWSRWPPVAVFQSLRCHSRTSVKFLVSRSLSPSKLDVDKASQRHLQWQARNRRF